MASKAIFTPGELKAKFEQWMDNADPGWRHSNSASKKFWFEVWRAGYDCRVSQEVN